MWALHNVTIVQDNSDSALISKFHPWFSEIPAPVGAQEMI